MDIAKYYLAKAKVSKSHTSVTVSLKKIVKISKSVLQEHKKCVRAACLFMFRIFSTFTPINYNIIT